MKKNMNKRLTVLVAALGIFFIGVLNVFAQTETNEPFLYGTSPTEETIHPRQEVAQILSVEEADNSGEKRIQVQLEDGIIYTFTDYPLHELVVDAYTPIIVTEAIQSNGTKETIVFLSDVLMYEETERFVFSNEVGTIVGITYGEEEKEMIFEIALSDGTLHSTTFYTDETYLTKNNYVIGENKPLNVYRYADEKGNTFLTEVYFDAGNDVYEEETFPEYDDIYEEEMYPEYSYVHEEGTIQQITKGENGDTLFQVALTDGSIYTISSFEDNTFFEENAYAVGNKKHVIVYTHYDRHEEDVSTEVYFNEEFMMHGEKRVDITSTEQIEYVTITATAPVEDVGWSVFFTLNGQAEEYVFYQTDRTFHVGETIPVLVTTYHDRAHNLVHTFHDRIEEY